MTFLRHWLWRIAQPRNPDRCDGSPFRLCSICTTPDKCREMP